MALRGTHCSFLYLCACVSGLVTASSVHGALPPVPVPPENPITEDKRVLGKVLFWDEQLSSDNTVACATCHSPAKGGTDPRLVRSPGPDGTLSTADDIFGSGGTIHSDAALNYVQDAVFGVNAQQTGRAANAAINAAYAPELFWDGRARGQFIDPQTGLVAIALGGALESQSVGPPVSSVEMAHPQWNWNALCAKIEACRPLDLARNLQPDVEAALAVAPTYVELFQRAFGDPQVTAKRVAFAIATYERTLIADQTAWDQYMAGDTGAMTANQIYGWQRFQASSRCNVCHAAPQFTDFSYRNIGARPITEDTGRQAVTGLTGDRGKFKTPSLRNTGLKRTYMHNGMFQGLGQVMAFYMQLPTAPPLYPDNMDVLMNTIFMTTDESIAIQDFITNALTDQRVANEQFPFDRLSLFTDRPEDKGSVVAGSGDAGSGGTIPTIVVNAPPMLGNQQFRVGVAQALGGAQATLGVSTVAPVGGRITPTAFVGTTTTSPGGAGAGVGTVHMTLLPQDYAPGTVLYVQWFVSDPGAPSGVAASRVGRLPLFCGRGGCPSACDSIDFNGDTIYPDTLDIADFLTVFAGGVCDGQQAGDTPCNTDIDFNNDTIFPDVLDIETFLTVFSGGACG